MPRDLHAWLNALISTVNATDRALAEELRSLRRSRSRSAGRQLGEDRRAAVRNIVLRAGRPVLPIVGGAVQWDLTENTGEVWRTRLTAARDHIRRAAAAVGRIEVNRRHGLEYVGTGWLVGEDTIVTNRHVARQLRGADASIDFLEELGSDDQLACPIAEILHIEDDEGPDLAFLRVGDSAGHQLARPIPLSTSSETDGIDGHVAVIGYPARDRRVPDQQLMQQIFGDVYEKKRLAPGQVLDHRDRVLTHDCSTLGGNSGSVVLDLSTGEAIGVHFAGRFLEANFAVTARVVGDCLERLRHSKPGKPAARPGPPVVIPPPADDGSATGGADPAAEPIIEGVPADYAGRAGYDPLFLGVPVPLPRISPARDVLTFQWEGKRQSELKYEHFSVVMNRRRRLCVFSAVNIDGSSPRRFKRPSWRLDPRIPSRHQIKEECYGREPLFSRGHMTRREDPIWGDAEEAARGNSDSMHVTNTVPQMQPFNAGIWLSLESYALEHARADDMRISVVTGPFLMKDDPVCRGVSIPRSFWKVIAFIHDETGDLCATGYTMSQDAFLGGEEFVYGKHQTAQTRIADIERRAGLSFGRLAALDPFDGDEEGVSVLLTDPAQIRFRRRR